MNLEQEACQTGLRTDLPTDLTGRRFPLLARLATTVRGAQRGTAQEAPL